MEVKKLLDMPLKEIMARFRQAINESNSEDVEIKISFDNYELTIKVEEVNLQKPENKNITCTNCRKVFKVRQSEFERHVYKAWFHNDKCKEQYLGL